MFFLFISEDLIDWRMIRGGYKKGYLFFDVFCLGRLFVDVY